jgi:hypothetical protein
MFAAGAAGKRMFVITPARVILKIVPRLNAPPLRVVPYNAPSRPAINGARPAARP